ncbi:MULTISPECIES: hypothetical protein [unclassified Ruegeria]|uniref:hypothetical protein n=1 Tax=unclassified Ruegeria TaxID=2625375 RepID=UPI001489C9BB|nr:MULTISPECIES: hypothetical protein [unclassified Ruegeria]NOD64874.1 hypothetical protein [Ruegeria sp. HKCCD6109]
MAIVEGKDATLQKVDDLIPSEREADPLDLPEGEAFDELDTADLDRVTGFGGRYRKTIAMGVCG